MAHVYFHCANSERFFVDSCGIDVEDFVEAHQRATLVIQHLVSSQGLDDWRAWTLHVSDEDGEEIFLMPFSYVLGRLH
jgi:uncharacterized protein DUF6894